MIYHERSVNDMSIDNMQLKHEEMLDDNVVLTDINPISNTKSVDDSATGEKLQKTIARIWEAINSKVSRQVNSINGRSGVVVLTPDDVGLGNVSNYSEAYYKKMILIDLDVLFHSHIIHNHKKMQNPSIITYYTKSIHLNGILFNIFYFI